MIHAKLIELMSPDADLRTYIPDDEDDFGILIEATIGPVDGDGGDLFSFQLCTANWLRKRYISHAVVFLRHVILVSSYDFKRIEESIEEICVNATGNNWLEVAEKLSRYGLWEFQDYQDNVG